MTKRKRIELVLLAAVLICACAIAALCYINSREPGLADYPKERLEKTTCETDLLYNGSSKRKCTLDLLWTEGEKPEPLVVLIHGGAWTGGSKEELNEVAVALSASGYAAANINYDLLPETNIAEQIQESKEAIRFLAEHAEEYNIDKENIVVMGYSAGGHLAASAAKELATEENDFKVVGCIDVFGPDALQYYVEQMDNDVSRWLIIHPDYIAGNQLDILSELAKVDPAADIPSNMPPVLILQGSKDTTVPPMISQEYYRALKESKVDARLEMLEGMDHELALDRTFDLMNDFIADCTGAN